MGDRIWRKQIGGIRLRNKSTNRKEQEEEIIKSWGRRIKKLIVNGWIGKNVTKACVR